MERTQVNSPEIKSVWYHDDNKILEIEFSDWWIFQYLNVPKYEFDWIMIAESYLKYLDIYIKPFYDFKKVW